MTKVYSGHAARTAKFTTDDEDTTFRVESNRTGNRVIVHMENVVFDIWHDKGQATAYIYEFNHEKPSQWAVLEKVGREDRLVASGPNKEKAPATN